MDDRKLIRDILPIEIWYEYRLARLRGRDLPDSVLEYFDLVSDEVYELAHRPPKDVNQAVQRALQFEPGQGKSSAFHRFAQFKTRMMILVSQEFHKPHGNWVLAKTDLAGGKLWPLTWGTRTIERVLQESDLLRLDAEFRQNKEETFRKWLREMRAKFKSRWGQKPLTETIESLRKDPRVEVRP